MKKYNKILLPLITLSVILLLFFLYKISIIKKVIIISNISDIKGLQIIEGKNLIFLKNDLLANHLLKNNPAVKNIIISKFIPDSLRIQIVNRKPIAIVSNEKVSLKIDEEGVYLTDGSDFEKLPIFQINNIGIYSDQKADWRIVKALAFLQYFNKGNIDIQNADIDDNANMYTFHIPNGVRVLMPYTGDVSKIAASLQVIISRFRIEGKSISIIDFRYDKPIVVLSNDGKKSSIIK